MPLRLIEMVLREKEGGDTHDLLKEHDVLDHRQVRLPDGEVLLRILLQAEQSEAVLDLLEKRYASQEGYRVVILPVEATLPQVEVAEDAAPPGPLPEDTPPGRISRQELYEDIRDAARLSRVYFVMVVLSTIVATIGLHHNSAAIVIGAMVIAPLLGPNIALALGTTLGDLPLARRSVLTGLAGIATVTVLTALVGALLNVDPTASEFASRTQVGLSDLALALAAGCAGVLAFTTGVSATLVGVMVAVALLPPMVTFGLLLGGGHLTLAMGALSLLVANLICLNLAGVMTFIVQGIRPATWWEKERAATAKRIALGLWASSLAALIGLILLFREI